ncbi:hypothetical protein COY90_03425 [Candidatus Roizmanbacteria bacterium CG_4_10_14_0_8_um_filter_39_9]|uniref:Transcriptional regulator n=1 Tax=Candidatus Roizmanbacteria bacterium CG_4_10_14_0_8_um_filter_39_9 TaxID=1974829 RepID=A0A2M7QDH4_9BACT|nr:MAG: hypothetical protein COY90_03425 [Candidatus Roizmanbacteria bacterium CG_4_10_14_0_8_um_filter_39_9]
MRHVNIVTALLKAKKAVQTVFTLNEMRQLLSISPSQLQDALYYVVKKKDIFRIMQGTYTFTKDYSREEFANKFRIPSYISLYTILQKEGIVFQPYTSLFAITNRSETLTVDAQTYIYRKIKDAYLLNSLGIELIEGVYMATPERALCDTIYLDGVQHFDNLRSINWSLMSELNEQVYKNNTIAEFIKSYITP